jgi:adenylate cyclase
LTAIPLTEPHFSGRDEELKILEDHLDLALHGKGTTIFISGEAGVGKTRLVSEFMNVDCAKKESVSTMAGYCLGRSTVPYFPFIEAFRAHFASEGKSRAKHTTSENLGVVSWLKGAEPKVGQLGIKGWLTGSGRTEITESPEILSPEMRKNMTHAAVAEALMLEAIEKPIVLFIDDLQWADSASLSMLHYISRAIISSRVLIIGTFRSGELIPDSEGHAHPLVETLRLMGREDLYVEIKLSSLSQSEVQKLAESMLSGGMDRDLIEKLALESQGNPLFAIESLRLLSESGKLVREDGRWRLSGDKVGIPDKVKDIILRRIDFLSSTQRRLLDFASVAGENFDAALIASAFSMDKLAVLENLNQISHSTMLVNPTDSLYRFGHAKFREVLYEELSSQLRKEYHARVAETIEKNVRTGEEIPVNELAFHYMRAGNKDKSVKYALLAGEYAQKRFSNAEAIDYFNHVLKTVSDDVDRSDEKLSALERLGDIYHATGSYEKAKDMYEKITETIDTGNTRLKVLKKTTNARAHRKIANVLWEKIGGTEKAKVHHEKALRILENESENVELASLYEDIAHMCYRTEDMARAISSAEKALEIAERLNAHEVVASSCASLGTALAYSGEKKKAIEYLEKALEISLDNGYMVTALRAYNNIPLALTSEQNERCLECYEKGYALAKKVGDVFNQSMLGFNLAGMNFNMGNIKDGVVMSNETVALDRKTGNIFHLYTSLSAMGYAYQLLGEMDKSEQCFKEASSVSHQLNDFQAITGGYDYLGLSHFDKGDYAKAREYLEKLDCTLEKAGDKLSRAIASQGLIWTYIELGQTEKARHLIDNTSEYASQTRNNDLMAGLCALKAILLRHEKKWEESIEYFEKSFQELEALKARRWSPHGFARMVLYEQAQVYLERKQEGDIEKAQNLLGQALGIFQKIGDKRYIEKILAEQRLLEKM